MTDLSAESAGSAADILLDVGYNDFQGMVHANGRDVQLKDNAGDLTLGQILVNGLLDVVTNRGAIVQDATSTIDTLGEASFTARNAASPADIRLNNSNNKFRSLVNVDGRNIEVNDSAFVNSSTAFLWTLRFPANLVNR
ncbi:hypothetical protein [Rhodopirellula bahusiensis]|uniref:hypothetical protein n=1 Tax=Rhodopirellula bahusiensis TaxID=2014065 RepID=UPI003D659EA1